MTIKLLLQLLVFVFSIGSVYALVAIGITLTFGVLKLINFAHGEFLMLAMYCCFWFWHYIGINPFLSLIINIPIFFFLGMGVEQFLLRPIIEKHSSTQILVTVGLSLIMSRGILAIVGPQPKKVTLEFTTRIFEFFGVKISYGQILMFLVSIALIIIIFIFLYKTYIGKVIRAVAQNRVGAKLMGINEENIYRVAFGIGIACVAAAGAIMSSIYAVSPSTGITFVLIAFIIVIMGGPTNFIGTLIASYVVGFIEIFSSYFIDPTVKEAVVFGFFIIVLLVKPLLLKLRRG